MALVGTAVYVVLQDKLGATGEMVVLGSVSVIVMLVALVQADLSNAVLTEARLRGANLNRAAVEPGHRQAPLRA